MVYFNFLCGSIFVGDSLGLKVTFNTVCECRIVKTREAFSVATNCFDSNSTEIDLVTDIKTNFASLILEGSIVKGHRGKIPT